MAKVALCIGINNYPGTDSDLSGCVNDANDWADELRSQGFRVQQLLDEQATKAAILRSMRDVTRSAVDGDTVVITFSGHGSFVPDVDGDEEDGVDECWCPHDVREHQIIDDEIHEIGSQRESGVRWVLISDSCHSGTMTRFSPVDTPPTMKASDAPQRLVRFLPPTIFCSDEKGLRKVERALARRRAGGSPPGRKSGLLLSGCQDTEYSYDAWFEGRANGAFTYVALSALRRLNQGATYQDWFEQIRDSLPSQQYPQTPNLYGTKKACAWPVFVTRDSADDCHPLSSPAQIASKGDAFQIGGALAIRLLEERDNARTAKRGRKAATRTRRKQDDVPLVAIGDSWLDYPRDDVRDVLEDDYGYDIESVADAGARVEDMAYSDGQLRKLLRTIDKMIRKQKPPKAVLLSGGGNDVAGDEFSQLLNHSTSPDRGLNEEVLAGVMDRIRDAYTSIVTSITHLVRDRTGEDLPIIMHGYDYAIPDGRGFLGGWWILPGPWLRPGFERKGYTDEREMLSIVKTLIDRLNEMQLDLLRDRDFANVHHVDIRGTLPSDGDYKAWWANELHPTQRGFDSVSRKFAATLEDVLRA